MIKEEKAMEMIKAAAEMAYVERQETHNSWKCPAMDNLMKVYLKYRNIVDEKKALAMISEIADKYPVE